MSKASDFAKAMTPQPKPEPIRWPVGPTNDTEPEFSVTNDGGLAIITQHDSPQMTRDEVLNLIKWLRETYED